MDLIDKIASLVSDDPNDIILESDVDRRRAERRSKTETGDMASQMQAMRHRMRQGEFGLAPSQTNIDLAAALGDKVAKQFATEQYKNYRFYSIRSGTVVISRDINEIVEISSLNTEEITNFLIDCIKKVLPVFSKQFPKNLLPDVIIQIANKGSPDDVQSINQSHIEYLESLASQLLSDPSFDWDKARVHNALNALDAISEACRYFVRRQSFRVGYVADNTARSIGYSDWVISRLADYLIGRAS